MNRVVQIPRMFRWLLRILLVMVLFFTAMRLVFFFYFNRQGQGLDALWPSFLLGFRFDLRAASFTVLVLWVLAAFKWLDPFAGKRAKKGWSSGFYLIAFVITLFYVVDFAHYAYLSQRLNATVLNYLQDVGISSEMVWQSYPVIRLALLLFGLPWALMLLFMRGYAKATSMPATPGHWKQYVFNCLLFLMLAFTVFGRFNQYPLRWSDAFALGNDYKANLALTPFESFLNTLKFRTKSYDEKEVTAYHQSLAPYFGWDARNPGSYLRQQQDTEVVQPMPNIVVVICESFSGYKSSVYGNPLKTTPFFDSLSRQGLFFERCFTPTYGTARGVWAVLTGLPDVELQQTASRNPAAVDQLTIMNQFNNHEKYYFIGGSPSWANIRGVLMNNLQGLHLYEEENLQSPRLDVWGISDKNLFLEANSLLAREKKPFFAIIQTADNHRPYSIPKEDLGAFTLRRPPEDSLDRFGFKDQVAYDDKLKEFNAFRYTDFTFQQFINAAQKEAYFKNTLFVFVGDHGIPGEAGEKFPHSWTEQRLTSEHVPLLFFAPGILSPSVKTQPCSQVDVMATIAGIVKQPVKNTGLGRNLMQNQIPFAFIFNPEARQIGIVKDSVFYRSDLKGEQEELVSVVNNRKLNFKENSSSRIDSLRLLSSGIYQTAAYLLLNNKKK